MDVLDQNEVDALLSAVEGGQVDPAASRLQIFSRWQRDPENLEIQPYDFRRPERVSKDQMRALQTLHDAFARNFGALLSGFLRTIVEIKLSSCEQMTYLEFVTGLPNPTSFNLIGAAQLEGQMCLEISPLIVYPILDRLLGGPPAAGQDLFVPQRPLTLIESGLISKVTSRAMEALTEAWANLRAIKFEVGETESNPHLVQIVPPNEVVVVIGFEVKMAHRAGTMNLCIPYNVIEPVMDDLASQSWFSIGKAADGQAWSDAISSRLDDAWLEVSAILADTTLTVGELLALGVGDVITTSKPASSPVTLSVEGMRKHQAHIGQHKGMRALKICGLLPGAGPRERKKT